MAIRTSQGSGAWSVAGTWDVPPVDGDAVVIAAGHSVLMDSDLSAYTGLLTVTIEGHATTPGMLYFKDGSTGHLKFRTGTNYGILGTNAAVKGRLLANSDGVWGNTGSLAFANKAIIELNGTSRIQALYLDIALYDSEPTNKSVRTYGTKYDFTASGATVDTANDTIDLGTPPPSAGTAVMITSAAGVLPTGLLEDTIYYVRGVSGNTCKLATQNSDETIVDITGTGSGTCTLFTGYASGSATVNVLDDVTADGPWVTTDGHDRVVLANAGPQIYDQQRLQLTTINAGSIVLSAAVDSTQYPGARIYLISRNVSIRFNGNTNIGIVDYTSGATHGGVFQCEINSTAGTGTTFYGYGILYGTGHTISGTISGCSSGIAYGTGHTISGTISGCSSGINSGTGHTISGTISGCYNGINSGTGHTISGTISGCYNGINSGTGHTISGTISGCSSGIISGTGHTISGTISGCYNGINSGPGHTISGTISGCNYQFVFNSGGASSGLSVSVRPSATLVPSAPTILYRNTVGAGGPFRQGVFFEDYGKVLGASYAYLMFGDVIKNTDIVRSGGAASSIEVVPLSNCAIGSEIIIFEWTELSVPASARNKSVYMRADDAWSVYPTADELYIEAEYISDGTTFATTVVKSNAVLSDGSTWVQFSIPEFTPAIAGHVRYRAYLKKYEASRKIYIDNMLVSA